MSNMISSVSDEDRQPYTDVYSSYETSYNNEEETQPVVGGPVVDDYDDEISNADETINAGKFDVNLATKKLKEDCKLVAERLAGRFNEFGRNASKKLSDIQVRVINASKRAIITAKDNLGRIAYIVSLAGATALIGVGFVYAMPLLIAGSVVAGSTALAGGIYEIRKARTTNADFQESFDALKEEAKTQLKERFIEKALDYFEIAKNYQNNSKENTFATNQNRLKNAYEELVKAYSSLSKVGVEEQEILELLQSVNDDQDLRIDLSDRRYGFVAASDSDYKKDNIVSWDNFSELLITKMVNSVNEEYQNLIETKAEEIVGKLFEFIDNNINDLSSYEINEFMIGISSEIDRAMIYISSEPLAKSYEQVKLDLLAKIVEKLGGEEKLLEIFDNLKSALIEKCKAEIIELSNKFRVVLELKRESIAVIRAAKEADIDQIVKANNAKINQLSDEIIQALEEQKKAYEKQVQNLYERVEEQERCEEEFKQVRQVFDQINNEIQEKQNEITKILEEQQIQIEKIRNEATVQILEFENDPEQISIKGQQQEIESIEKKRDHDIESAKKIYLEIINYNRTILAKLLNNKSVIEPLDALPEVDDDGILSDEERDAAVRALEEDIKKMRSELGEEQARPEADEMAEEQQ